MFRGIIGLSIGTTVTRGLAAVAQIVLAFWLTPAEFGYWAAATSAIALLSGLANFGEVNAYLSGHGTSLAAVKRSTRIMNLSLTVIASLVASAYLFGDRPEVAMLAFVAAFSIPFAGDAELMYSAGVKVKAYRAVVLAQVLGAVCKVAVGIAIAIFTGSAIAIAISTLVFYVVMDLGLMKVVSRATRNESRMRAPVPFRTRMTWATNSVAMTLPLQVGFLVAQFIATPEILGLFFFSFQVTLGISGLVAAPLARVALSTLGAMAGGARLAMALKLCNLFGIAMLVFVAVAAGTLPYLSDLVPSEWRLAVPAIAVLIASLPARMMGPVVDAYQQATNRWGQSTFFNLLDAVGTATAALFAFTGDILHLVLAIALWKIILAIARTLYVFRAAPLQSRLLLTVPVGLGSLLVCSVPFVPTAGMCLSIASLVIAGLWALAIRFQASGPNRS